MSFSGPNNYGKGLRGSLRTLNPFYCLAIFAFKWQCSRPKRYFLRSLPAIATSIILALLLTAGQQRADQMVEFYEALVKERFNSNDLAAAQLYLEKVAQLDGHNQRRMFDLGLVVEQRGHAKQALQIMRRLAPDHEARFPPAHRWMAKRIGGSQPTEVQTEQLRHHLTAALSVGPNPLPESQQLQVRDRLAQLELSNQRLAEAARHLRIGFNSDPRFAIRLARVYRLQGERENASSTISTAVGVYTKQLNENLLNVMARTKLAELAAFDEDYPQAEKLLIDGLQLADLSVADRAQLRKDLGLFSVQWAAFLAKSEPDSWQPQLALLNRAMESIPNNPLLFNQFARLTDADTDAIRAVVDVMKRLLASGQETALAHWVLGTALVRLDDLPLAEQHLRLAIDADPKLGAGLNNLAWVLAHRKPARLEEASQLIEIALKALPNHPEVRETRGQIYLRMGEFEKATIDLEFAIQRVRGKPAVHLALSQAYRQMGDTDLADSHQELARTEQAKLK